MTTPASELVIGLILGLTIALLAGSAVRLFALRGAPSELRRKRLASLFTWWLLSIMFCLAIYSGFSGLTLLLALAACLALMEYLRFTGLRQQCPHATLLVYALALAHFAAILFGNWAWFFTLLPIWGLFLIALGVILSAGGPKDYIRHVGGLYWGVIVLVFGLSHTLLPFGDDTFALGPAGAMGWVLYLVILTEVNDIAQALVGRRFGVNKRHLITPVISPNKTWEGLIGGTLVTVVLAILLAPVMTTLDTGDGVALTQSPWLMPTLAGLVIVISGFFGDINMSAVKRDCGVKDSGNLLPGMGGIIDRIDSLTWSAPAFVYFVLWLK